MPVVSVILASLALFLVGTPVVVLLQSHFARKRWGTVEGPLQEVGQGAYRATVVRTHVDRGAPTGMKWATALAAAWAAVTLGIFVPLGGLTAAVTLDSVEHLTRWPPEVYATVLLLAVFVATGSALGAGMIGTCVSLARRHTGSEERALRVSRFCYGHHGALWLAGTLLAMTDPERMVMWSMMLSVPCIFGGFAALALSYAADEALARTRTELFRAPEPPTPPDDVQTA